MQSLNNGVGSQQISGLTGSGNLPLIQCKQDGLRRLNVGVGSHIYFTGLTGSGNLPLTKWEAWWLSSHQMSSSTTLNIDSARDVFPDPDEYNAMQYFFNGVGSQLFTGLTGSGNLPLMQCKPDGQRCLQDEIGLLAILCSLPDRGNLLLHNWDFLETWPLIFTAHSTWHSNDRAFHSRQSNDEQRDPLGVGYTLHSGLTDGGNLPPSLFTGEARLFIHNGCEDDTVGKGSLLLLLYSGPNMLFDPIFHCAQDGWTLSNLCTMWPSPGSPTQDSSQSAALRLNWDDPTQCGNRRATIMQQIFHMIFPMSFLMRQTTTSYSEHCLRNAFDIERFRWLFHLGWLLCFAVTISWHCVFHDFRHRISHCLGAQQIASSQSGIPGPKSRGRLQPKTSRYRTFHLACVFILGLIYTLELVRGEGCTLVMEGAEVSHTKKLTQHTPSDTKRHDTRPETCKIAAHWSLPQRQRPVVKRSIRRAYARALQQGFSWYKGRSYAPPDFPKALRENFQPSLPPQPVQMQPMNHCNWTHIDKARFRVLNWNAGGLSAYRLDELKVWMKHQCIEAAIITETRWKFESTWSDSDFHFVHTGDPQHAGQGILCILAKHFCPADQLKWRVIHPGRLVHIQVQLTSRAIDLIGCYQHTYAATTQRHTARAQLWDQLDQLMHGLVARNILVLGGDFNCDLLQAASHSGPEVFHWKGSLTRGALHRDNGRFTSLLRLHGLVALNTWTPTLGPTYAHANACSRIDLIITRKQVADGVSKDVMYARDAPFQGEVGHVPMIAHNFGSNGLLHINIVMHGVSRHNRGDRDTLPAV